MAQIKVLTNNWEINQETIDLHSLIKNVLI